ncbi:MAG: hypothetical protein QM535_08185 [Limnohabitans sp.]|nr:hypothetical protein [Limnohabitans sp.]
MDFNDIQSAWENEAVPNVSLPNKLEKLESVNMPLDKIRKNLKKELITQVGAIVVIGLIPLLYKFSDNLLVTFYLLFLPFLAICTYFLIKLYSFYKRIHHQNLNTKDSLYETYYDIMLNLQLYKSFTYSLMPFVIMFVMLIFLRNYSSEEVLQIFTPEKQKKILGFVTGLFVGVTISVGFVTEWWVNFFYGKYASEIRKVIDELKE